MGADARDAVVHSGDVIDGRYRVIDVVGEGGMGTVYLAEHQLIKRRVAVKVLRPDLASDGNVIKRFMNEARAAGTLGHPNIVESTDMGFIDRTVPYIVFEYLEGTLLTDEIARVGQLPVRRAVKITRQIASALGAAHRAGIVHRDLKSDNIFLTDRGDLMDHVKVLDFGISKFLEAGDDRTRRGMVMGTPEFMAPEQITDPDSVDVRSDVYALGATLYEMVVGRRAFSNDDPRTLLHRIVHTDAPDIERPDLPRGLHDLIFKMMAKNPDHRLQEMADVEAVLDLYVTHSDAAPQGRIHKRRSHAALEDTAPQPALPAAKAVARDTPLPFQAANTPWPAAEPGTLTTVTAAPPRRSPIRLLFVGVAAAGLVLAGAWLGPRLGGHTAEGGGQQAAAPAPAPTIVTMPAAATAPAPAERATVDLAVEADAPGARVVFRRRLQPAPFKTTVLASDIVELVEVDAPGCKTVRYWLTIDRPTTLHARLPKGTGMVEATEAEILVALGEAEPPEPVAPAQPAEPAPAARGKKAPARPAAVAARPAPRRIGKSAATATAAAAPGAGASAAGIASVGHADEPAPLLTADLSNLVDGTSARPVTRPDQVAPEVVARVMGKYRPQVVACRDRASGAGGAVTVGMTVDPSGAVSRPQVTSTLEDPEVVGCILKAAASWRFPARGDGARPAHVSHKFTLK